MESIDTLIEKEYLIQTQRKVEHQFADAEAAVTTSLEGDQQAKVLDTLTSIKMRVAEALYNKGIADHKKHVVRRMSDRVY